MATGEGRAYELIFTPEARQAMAGWPREIQHALQTRLEQLASLPLVEGARQVESVVTAGNQGEFRLAVELRPDTRSLIVRPPPAQ